MNEQAHIFAPIDNSLAERVKAYQSVYIANIRAEASLGVSSDSSFKETLGTVSEMQDAAKITRYSMKVASEAFDQEEMQVIAQKGLLDKPQLDALHKIKIQQEFESVSQKSNQSNNHSHKL
jgi:hypothetical protein